jgi:hypothetical protein
MVTPTMMRQLWTLVESTQASTLLYVDDSALVQWLLKQLMAQQSIDPQAASTLSTYIQAKLPLIRDTAEGRKIVGQGCH